MQYDPNKKIQISFTIRESLYDEFKKWCKVEKRMPATVLRELIQKYSDERKTKLKCVEGSEKESEMF